MRTYIDKATNEIVIRIPIQPKPINPSIGVMLRDYCARPQELKAAYQWDHESIAVALQDKGTTDTSGFLFFILR